MLEVIQFYYLFVSAVGVEFATGMQSARSEGRSSVAETRPRTSTAAEFAAKPRQLSTSPVLVRQNLELGAVEVPLQPQPSMVRSAVRSAAVANQAMPAVSQEPLGYRTEVQETHRAFNWLAEATQLRNILVSTFCVLLLLLGLSRLQFSARVSVPRPRSAKDAPWVAYLPRKSTSEHVLLADMSPQVDDRFVSPLQPKPSIPYAAVISRNREAISSISSSPVNHGAGDCDSIGSLSSRSLIERLDEILGKNLKQGERLFGKIIDKVADPCYDSIDLTADPQTRKE